MGHSTSYREDKKAADNAVEQHSSQPAWRRIEDWELMRQFRRDLEFFDDHLEGNLEEYLR
ncbi:MAG: hypothetical protein ACQES2_02335 [Pseudomonadota bacterium]